MDPLLSHLTSPPNLNTHSTVLPNQRPPLFFQTPLLFTLKPHPDQLCMYPCSSILFRNKVLPFSVSNAHKPCPLLFFFLSHGLHYPSTNILERKSSKISSQKVCFSVLNIKNSIASCQQKKHLLVTTPGIFVISTMVIGHEDRVQPMTCYSYVYLKNEAIATLNRRYFFPNSQSQ